MVPAAKKSLIAGVLLLAGGAVLVGYGAQAYSMLADVAGRGADPGLQVVSVILTILRLSLMPLGAALVGAAVVIQAIVPMLPVREHAAEDAGEPEPAD